MKARTKTFNEIAIYVFILNLKIFILDYTEHILWFEYAGVTLFHVHVCTYLRL